MTSAAAPPRAAPAAPTVPASSPLAAQLALLGVWILGVAPFLGLGYGSDDDSALVYRAAHRIWETGAYWRSRSTGFPLYELAVTPFVHFGGALLSNAFSALCGVVYLLALFRLWRRGHFRHPVLVVLCAAFIPVLIKNASSTMDYVAALAVLAWAYVLLVEGRTLRGAALIGIAAGFRPSSGLVALPASLMVWRRTRSFARGVWTGGVAAIAGVVAFAPALLKYGIANTFSSQRLGTAMSVPKRLVLMGYYGSQLYGVIGTVLIVALLVWAIVKWPPARDGADRAERWFHATTIGTYAAMYALLPVEPEYLLPITFSVAVLMDRVLSRRMFVLLTVVLLSYHVIQLDPRGGASGSRRFHPALAPGFTVRDAEDRMFKQSLRHAAATARVARPTLLLYGYQWLPDLEGGWQFMEGEKMWRQTGGNLYIAQRMMDADQLRVWKARGFRIVVWKPAVSDYLSGAGASRRPYVEVVDRLEDVVGGPLRGRAATE